METVSHLRITQIFTKEYSRSFAQFADKNSLAEVEAAAWPRLCFARHESEKTAAHPLSRERSGEDREMLQGRAWPGGNAPPQIAARLGTGLPQSAGERGTD